MFWFQENQASYDLKRNVAGSMTLPACPPGWFSETARIPALQCWCRLTSRSRNALVVWNKGSYFFGCSASFILESWTTLMEAFSCCGLEQGIVFSWMLCSFILESGTAKEIFILRFLALFSESASPADRLNPCWDAVDSTSIACACQDKQPANKKTRWIIITAVDCNSALIEIWNNILYFA